MDSEKFIWDLSKKTTQLYEYNANVLLTDICNANYVLKLNFEYYLYYIYIYIKNEL